MNVKIQAALLTLYFFPIVSSKKKKTKKQLNVHCVNLTQKNNYVTHTLYN